MLPVDVPPIVDGEELADGEGLGVPVSEGLGVGVGGGVGVLVGGGAVTWNCAHGFTSTLTATQMVCGPGRESGIVTPLALRLPSPPVSVLPSALIGLSKKSPTCWLGGKDWPLTSIEIPGGPDVGLTCTTGCGVGDGLGATTRGRASRASAGSARRSPLIRAATAPTMRSWDAGAGSPGRAPSSRVA